MYSPRCQARHRHSIFCILPPHVLREMAQRGTPAQRNAALGTMALDSTHRAQRMAFMLLAAGSFRPPVVTGAAPQVQRTIYTAGNSQTLPGTLVRAEGQANATDVSVNEAYDGLGATFDFYWNAYQRNSIDDAGPAARRHRPLRPEATTTPSGTAQQMVFGDGDGNLFNRFTIALDVIGHELTHGVTEDEASLAYFGQSGALERVDLGRVRLAGQAVRRSDQTADQADWLIGAGLLTSVSTAWRCAR